jgi:arginine-tRNA-protein transferase
VAALALPPNLRITAGDPPELVVYDEPGPCAYLEGEVWRLPLRLPLRALTREEFGMRLSQGDRRQGRMLYRTGCPSCRACEPIRIEVERFVATRSQRRILRRGNGTIRVMLGPIEVSSERVQLYNVHKQSRDLARDEEEASIDAYQSFLGDSCVESFEMRYDVAGERLGFAIVDRADDALSAVYFYWNPKFRALSPGTYSILKQVELCRRLGLPYLYLGLYIARCATMAYKGGFLPHERLVDGRWQRFDRPPRGA